EGEVVVGLVPRRLPGDDEHDGSHEPDRDGRVVMTGAEAADRVQRSGHRWIILPEPAASPGLRAQARGRCRRPRGRIRSGSRREADAKRPGAVPGWRRSTLRSPAGLGWRGAERLQGNWSEPRRSTGTRAAGN